MQAVTTIGLDIAKSVFQVHGVDAAGQVLIRRQYEASRHLGVLSRSCCPVWSVLRPVPRRTIGRANSRHLAIRCG